jgi:hypothetical protein
MLHPGSRFQMAGDLLETYLLWLTEAHALAPATWAATSKTTSSYRAELLFGTVSMVAQRTGIADQNGGSGVGHDP